jgi:hypothetical protein
MQGTFSWAQTDSSKVNQLSVGLNVMTHGEIMRGGLPLDQGEVTDDKSNFLLGRFRLIVGYERPGLEVNAVLQNRSVWGTNGSQSLNLYEGWVKMSAKCGLFAQVGRVALSYDDERIIGTNDFAMASLSHDVLRVGYEGHGHLAHLILAYNQNVENVYSTTYYINGSQSYKTMQTLWYHYDVPKFPLGASLLFMNVGVQAGKQGDEGNPPSTEYQQLYGGYLNFHPKHLTLEGSYYRQAGKTVDLISLKGMDTDAWMASFKATVNPNDFYGFTAGYDYLSGDDNVIAPEGPIWMIRHDKIKGFIPLYGSRNKFYGIMDYFYASAFVSGFTPGLQNAFLGVFGKPTRKFDIGGTYHYLAVATEVSGLGRTLGHSIDLQASYNFTKDISLQAGYTLMFGTETMSRLKRENSSKTAQWGWFSLIISPRLFTTRF